jgi:hypothetical protein
MVHRYILTPSQPVKKSVNLLMVKDNKELAKMNYFVAQKTQQHQIRSRRIVA